MQLFRSGNGPGRQRGFTFGEVVATLGVLGVRLSLVVPSLSSVTESNLRASGINELVATLHTARNEAITRNQGIVICPSVDGETCSAAPWEAGWIRFIDTNGDFGVDPGERLLGVSPPLGGLRIQTVVFGPAIGYAPSGRVLSPTRGQTGGDFSFCPVNSPENARVLAVSALGHPVLSDRHADGQEADCSVG
ncbi:MAG: GspH/FimT family protein [Gammaproteobacteria bacterium]|nr:GspH/FimT family protein [Gammaproteobacteria bacterium]